MKKKKRKEKNTKGTRIALCWPITLIWRKSFDSGHKSLAQITLFRVLQPYLRFDKSQRIMNLRTGRDIRN